MSSTNISKEKILCANPLCENILANKAIRCSRCKEVQCYCPSCGSSTRVLSRFCRVCGTTLRNNWSVEQPGLRARPVRNIDVEVKAVFQLDWELSVDSEMTATPLAARGIIILTLNSGHIVILDEVDGNVRTELATTPPLSFTPIISDNLLIVATGDGIVAFDLIAAIYGNVARGGVKIWQHLFNADEQVTQPLLAISDIVIAVVKNAQETHLLILDKKTGQKRHKLLLDDRANKTTMPYLKGKDLFIGIKGGTVLAIDIAQAKIIAKSPPGRGVDTNIIPTGLGNSLLYVLADSKIWSSQITDLAQGKITLQPFGDIGGLLINSLASSDKYLAIAHGFGMAIYDAFGKQIWETQLDGNSIVSPPLIVGDWLWVIDDSGIMFFFNLKSSVPRLRQRIFEYSVSLPTILTAEKLIFSNQIGQIKVFRWK